MLTYHLLEQVIVVYRIIREDMHKNNSASEIPAAEEEQKVLTEGSV